MINKQKETIKSVVTDFLAAALSWSLFFTYRKYFIEQKLYGQIDVFYDKNFLLGVIIIPLFWVLIYYSVGTYRNILRKSRLKEFGKTIGVSFLGVLLIFFIVVLDDRIINYKTYYSHFFVLFSAHFFLTAIFRFILSTRIANNIHNRKFGFNTLMIGSNENALNLFNDMQNDVKSSGHKFIGFVSVIDDNEDHILSEKIEYLGSYKNLVDVINKYKVEDVIIAVESSEHKKIGEILNLLSDTNVIIKVIPDMYDILSGTVKMTSIWSSPLIVISPELMPQWQFTIKRLMDIFGSIFGIIILSPVLIFTAAAVYFTSKGPILYLQERIGLNGVPFKMYKFRSMHINAEKNGPALSSKNDPRITRWGLFMRKVRLDEIPQFFNILKGDMSFVGFRPERQFFLDQILVKAPHYKYLLKIKPGMTSWGQVKYGYAENVDQMVERLKYDIMYIENMSLALDLKILIYTVLIVFQGRGK